MFTVHDPTVPFTLPLHEPFVVGSTVEVHGHSKHHDTFAVELLAGQHIVLHLSFRFHHHEHELVMNAQSHGTWGVEQRVHNPIPKHDHHFRLHIHVHETHYDIEVDGQQVATFVHRFPYQSVQAIGVHGHVHIGKVHFEGFGFTQPWETREIDYGHGGFIGYGTSAYVAPVFDDGHQHAAYFDPYRS